MLKNIDLKNYKSFSNAKLEIKPLTILLGANSSGKSSLLQLFLLLAQTTGNGGPSLRTSGALTSLGHPANILHKRDQRSELEIGFNVDPVSSLSPTIVTTAGVQFLRRFSEHLKDSSNANLNVSENSNNALNFITSLEGKKLDDDTLRNLIKNYAVIAKDARSMMRKVSSGRKTEISGLDSVAASLPGLADEDSAAYKRKMLDQAIDVIEALALMGEIPKITNICYKFGYIRNTSQIEVLSITINCDKRVLLSLKRRNKNRALHQSLSSEIFNLNFLKKYNPSLKGKLSINGLEVKFEEENFSKKFDDEPFSRIFSAIINRATKAVNSYFTGSSIKHVSPLRAFPKRYYYSEHLSGDNLIANDGNSLADVLKRKTQLREHVNKWLKKFGLSVNVHDIKDLIKSIRVRQNGMDMDLTDVGFGISQILPVIAQGFTANQQTITLIEQPEIHLHPKMQAELADLFIDMINHTSGKLIIETHSEYLLRRLRLRIAEGKIPANSVAIQLIHSPKAKKGARIEHVAIAKKGAFKWPKDFAEIDLRDTLDFAKLQDTDFIKK